jgi:hypothetical protein
MALYSRAVAHESRAADEIYGFISAYYAGVTVRKLMSDHPDRLKDSNSVLAAIDLLTEEGKIGRQISPGQDHSLDSIRVWPT